MRFWIAGPRIGGFRPGVSFGRSDFRRAAYTAAASPAAPGYVYVITAAHGRRKIGSSGDPPRRLATLQTGSPHRLWIEFQSPRTDRDSAYRIEIEAHAILASQRGEGEWFAVTSDMAIATIFAAADRTGCSLASAPQMAIGARRGWRNWPTLVKALLLAVAYAAVDQFVPADWGLAFMVAWVVVGAVLIQ